MHKKFNKFLQSVVVLPVLATSFALNPAAGITAKLPTAAAISPEQTRTLTSEVVVNPQLTDDQKVAAQKLDAFFAKYNLPMEGKGEKLVSAAVANGLDKYDVALIALEESTACKFIIKGTNNCFGWGSGKIKFSSIDEGIDTVAKAISGNSPETARYYKGRPMDEVLAIYNGRANNNYLADIKSLKRQINAMQVEPEVSIASL